MTSTTLYATSFVSGGVSTPARALGAPDGLYTTDTGNTNWIARWNLGTLAAGQNLSGTQTIRIRFRRDADGGNAPTINSVDLYENGVLVNTWTGIASPASTAAADRDFTFADTLVDGDSQLAVEINTTGSGGSPTVRRSVQLDAITWFAEHVDPPAPPAGSVVNYWDGAAWQPGIIKRWSGTEWQSPPLKRWSGTEWVAV